jgi:hypothetical protein
MVSTATRLEHNSRKTACIKQRPTIWFHVKNIQGFKEKKEKQDEIQNEAAQP